MEIPTEQALEHPARVFATPSIVALLFCACMPAATLAASFVCTDDAGLVFKTRQRIQTALLHCEEQPEDSRPERTYAVARPISIFFDEPGSHTPAANPRFPQAPMPRGLPAQSPRPIPPSRAEKVGSTAEIEQMIVQVARQYGHEVSLLRSIIYAESRFNPNARSPKGAVGLMQIIPATARRYGVMNGARELYDPYTNLHTGARYLADLKKMFPQQLPLVVAAYNAGENAVLKYGRVPPYAETQSYVRQVLEMHERLRAPALLASGY